MLLGNSSASSNDRFTVLFNKKSRLDKHAFLFDDEKKRETKSGRQLAVKKRQVQSQLVENRSFAVCSSFFCYDDCDAFKMTRSCSYSYVCGLYTSG